MIYKLKDLCSIEKGKTSIQKANPGKYPLVVTAEDRSSCDYYQFDREAVCIPLVSSSGHGVASMKRIHYQKGKFALGNILCAMWSKNEAILSNKFLYIFFSFYKDQKLVPLMKGSANVSLSISKIQNIEIELPSIEIQEKIVNSYEYIVETLISKINDENNDLTTNLESMKRKLIENAFMNSQYVLMSDIFTIEKGKLQSSKCTPGKYKFITASAEWKTHNSFTYTDTEALIYAVGAEGSLGRVHYVNDTFIASDLCFVLTSKKELIYRLYQEYFMLNRQEIVSKLATGTSKKSINYSNFSNYKIPYIDYQKQEEVFNSIMKISSIEGHVCNINEFVSDFEYGFIKDAFNKNNIN